MTGELKGSILGLVLPKPLHQISKPKAAPLQAYYLVPLYYFLRILVFFSINSTQLNDSYSDMARLGWLSRPTSIDSVMWDNQAC